MCATCGCGHDDVRVSTLGHDEEHAGGHVHPHEHQHPHDHPHEAAETLVLEERVFAKNDALAEHNRAYLTAQQITTLNLMSSPGSGKTSLLERTIADLRTTLEIGVIEGDQETLLDAERIRSAGARAVQINTGAGCHLDADMLYRGLETLNPSSGSLVFVENVGNLVCPALFDLGEARKVVVISVTEGDDKPLKYPHMFAAADLVIVNKTDLLPYVDFDLDRCTSAARSLNPGMQTIALSVRSGDNIDAWYGWLRATMKERVRERM